MQQITAVSATINGGDLYTPYIVKNLIDSNTNTILKSYSPNKKRNVISKDTSDLVRFTLQNVVANGTGRNAYIENYNVGGKTGTAQKVVDGRYSSSEYILSFIGFLPVENPEIVVYVAVDSPKNTVQYGGTVSAPIAKNVMTSAIDILGIKESKEKMPKIYTWMDQKYIVIDNVVGKSVNEAKKILKKYKINYSGHGNKIVYQSPQSGSYIKEGGTVNLMLG